MGRRDGWTQEYGASARQGRAGSDGAIKTGSQLGPPLAHRGGSVRLSFRKRLLDVLL